MTKEEFYARAADFLNEYDHFAKKNNIRITKIREGYAEAVFEADDRHLNGLGIVQGGALYTLADLAFAGASNSYGDKCVAMTAAVSFIRPGSGKILRAAAREVNKGRRSCVIEVEVRGETEKLVAKIQFTGFFYEK